MNYLRWLLCAVLIMMVNTPTHGMLSMTRFSSLMRCRRANSTCNFILGRTGKTEMPVLEDFIRSRQADIVNLERSLAHNARLERFTTNTKALESIRTTLNHTEKILARKQSDMALFDKKE